MSLPAELRPSVEEFVAWEAEQEASHEYVDGDIVLMSPIGYSPTGEIFNAPNDPRTEDYIHGRFG